MNATNSAGARLRAALDQECPLQVVGVVNAYAARLAQAVGFRALYISGGGVAASSCGLPDVGITTLDDVLSDVHRIVETTELPVLVDIDTGWGGVLNIAQTIQAMIRAGAAGVHLEDQVAAKRCGHRPGKAVVSQEEMVDRIRAAVKARTDPNFVIMARTDALAVEGLAATLQRVGRYVEAGADMLFPEGVLSLAQFQQFVDAVPVPVLANLTEFGVTPLLTVEELRRVGIKLVLYPLSAFRAMSAAALRVYQAIRTDGTQQNVLETMQTREELYHYLGYHAVEQELDRLLAQERQ
jgi:methylisocitrate lyase